MEYPKRLHDALMGLPGVVDVALGIRSLQGIDEKMFSLPGEFADLPHLALRRSKGGLESEALVSAEVWFRQDMPGWIGLEFLAWWVRDLSRSSFSVQLRPLALPPVAYGTQLGRTLKFVVEIFVIDATQESSVIEKELDALAESMEQNQKTYAEALAKPTQAYPPDIESLTKCAQNEDCVAQLRLAQCYAVGEGVTQDHKQAFSWFERSSKHGHPEAWLYLGNSYFLGNGVDVDQSQAAELYRKAAEAGLPVAMGFLGKCYEEGKGIEKDEAKAAEWYKKGAEAGEVTCLAQLGECYEFGRGVPLDLAEAFTCYMEALEQGFEPVKTALKRLQTA